jgi:HlyD family secretion protein
MHNLYRVLRAAFRTPAGSVMRVAMTTLGIIVGVAAVSGSAGIGRTACADETPSRQPSRTKKDAQQVFRTAPTERGRLIVTVGATGTLQPQEVVDVGAQATGRVAEIGKDLSTRSKIVDWGSEVEAGTVLAQLDDTRSKAQVAVARASVAQAKADLLAKTAQLTQATADWQRAQKLFPSGGISQGEYDLHQAQYKSAVAGRDISRAAVAVAEGNLKLAEIDLDYSTIRSPVKGVVIDRRVNVGQTVVAGLSAPSLFLIAKDLRKLELWATVNEVDIGKIKVGQDVRFTVDAYPGKVYKGKVVPQGKLPVRLNAALGQNTVTYTAVVNVDNSNLALLPYMTANLSFIVADKKDALLVPIAALRWLPASKQIAPDVREAYMRLKNKKRSPADDDAAERGLLWMAGKDSFVRYLEIRTGLSDGTNTEVLGVTGGDELPKGAHLIVGERSPAAGKADSSRGANQLARYGMSIQELLVMPGIASSGGVTVGGGSVLTLTPQDADAIARECRAVQSAAPVVRTRTQLTFADRRWVPAFIYGTTPSFLDVREWQDLAEGEPFTEKDVRNQARVCLIGQTIKRELFDNQSPIGREIRMQNVGFRVIGVLSARGANAMGLDQDDVVLAPWTSIKARVSSSLPNVKQGSGAAAGVNAATTVNSLKQSYPGTQTGVYPAQDPLRALDYPQQTRFTAIDQILVRARSEEEIRPAIRQITELLRRRHHIKSGQPDDFGIRDMTELARILGTSKKR